MPYVTIDGVRMPAGAAAAGTNAVEMPAGWAP
jgi:hypothetical protein